MEYKSIPADKNIYGFRLTNIAKNIVIIIATTFLLFVIFAFVITYTNIPTDAVSPVIFGITIIIGSASYLLEPDLFVELLSRLV